MHKRNYPMNGVDFSDLAYYPRAGCDVAVRVNVLHTHMPHLAGETRAYEMNI